MRIASKYIYLNTYSRVGAAVLVELGSMALLEVSLTLWFQKIYVVSCVHYAFPILEQDAIPQKLF